MQPLQHEDVVEDIIFPTHGNNIIRAVTSDALKQTLCPCTCLRITSIPVTLKTGWRYIYRQDGTKRLSAGIFLLRGRYFGISPRRGDTLNRSRWNLVGRIGPFLSNFTLIGSGVCVYGPKTLKIWNITNIIAPMERVPCTILAKFTEFMCILSLHNSAKFFVALSRQMTKL